MKYNVKSLLNSKFLTKTLNICRCFIVAGVFSLLSSILFTSFERRLHLIFNWFDFNEGKYFTDSGVVSSVWCHVDVHDITHKTCSFSNLCWLPYEKQFLFLLGEESVLSGVADWHEISSIDLSSVAGHNRFLLKIAVITIPVASEHPLSHHLILKENEWVYLLWRFKPDNIMHILHDDLLPLYFAYEEVCAGDVKSCVEKYKLILLDDIANDYAYDLYQIFSRQTPSNEYNKGGKLWFLKENKKKYQNTTICFSRAMVGLPRTTAWFQYGFGKPQGPIERPGLSLAVMKRFAKFMINEMKISVPADLKGKHDLSPRALYISRNVNRRILNEMEVINATKNVYSEVMGNNNLLVVDYFNPAPNSSMSGVKEIFQAILRWPLPKLVLGMHSAALTVVALLCLAVKSKDDMAFMELFPMGIDPAAVSPMRALIEATRLENSNHVFYETWTNTDPSSSVLPAVHSDPLVGGGHTCQGLDLRSVLPPVECCHQQDYLCRMFQDTIVDTKQTFPNKLRSLFLQQRKCEDSSSQASRADDYQDIRWFFPAEVRNIQCLWNITKDKGYLLLSWVSPINLFKHSHHYDATISLKSYKEPKEMDGVLNKNRNKGQDDFMSFMGIDISFKVKNTSAVVKIPDQFMGTSNCVLKANIWLQCVVSLKHMESLKRTKSVDAFHECSVNL